MAAFWPNRAAAKLSRARSLLGHQAGEAGVSVNQEQIDRRLAEIGGGALVHTPILQKKTVKSQKPDAFGDMVPTDVEVDVQQWINERTGHVLQAAQLPDGTWQVVKDDPKGVTPKPAGDTRSTAAAADPNTPQGRAA